MLKRCNIIQSTIIYMYELYHIQESFALQ